MKRQSQNIDNDAESKRMCLEPLQPPGMKFEKKPNDAVIVDNGYKKHYPSKFISSMYKLHLSVLCWLRKLQYKEKSSTLTVSFEDPDIDKFKDIVIRYEKQSIHIQVVDDHYIDYSIGYTRLFSKNHNFSLNRFFNSFVKYQICRSFNFLRSVDYLVIFTNLDLDLTEYFGLSDDQRWKSNLIRFEKIDVESLGIFKKLLLTESTTKKGCYYKFSQDEATRKELLGKLELSNFMQKAVIDRKLTKDSVDKIKEKFLNKLVFAVNQPHREELKLMVKSELNRTCYSFTDIQKKVVNSIPTRPVMVYELNFLVSALNDLLSQDGLFLNYEHDTTSSLISVHFRNKVTYIKFLPENKRIGYNQLFPSGAVREESKFSLNSLFLWFIKNLEKNGYMKFLIIYTNAQLDLSNNLEIRGLKSQNCHKFEVVNTNNKRFKVLRCLSALDQSRLYQFSSNELETLPRLLEYPSDSWKRDKRISDEQILYLKQIFLHKLVFATGQPTENDIECITRSEINRSTIVYNYELLQETCLRWLESYKIGLITNCVAREILDNVKNDRSTYQKLQRKDISKEIQFTKNIVGKEGSPVFNSFLQYVLFGEGKKYLKNFQNSGLRLSGLSGMLIMAGSKATEPLKKLHDLWYDHEGRESKYLLTLRSNGVKIATVTTLLYSARHCAPDAFLDLFFLWFDNNGNKTRYLSVLEKERISLTRLSSILIGAGPEVSIVFRDLIDLLFDKSGGRTEYLRLPEENGITLSNFTNILHGAGKNAVSAFKSLYDIWFDKDGTKSSYVKVLEKNCFSLKMFSPILRGSGIKAANIFEKSFYLFFDKDGNRTQHLITLEKEDIRLHQITGILNGAGSHFTEAFKDLYDLWFDSEGNKTQYLKDLTANGINLSNLSSILHGSGSRGIQAFKNLYHLWIDENGNKSVYLQTLEKNGISIDTMGGMLSGSKISASGAYKAMHQVFFDEHGNRSERLKHLEEGGVNLTNISSLLTSAGSQIKAAFDEIYELWFDEFGKKTQYLTNIDRFGIKLSNMSSILNASGCHTAKAYKNLYHCWFDEEGNKTQYLEIFEENGLNLSSIVGILQEGGRYSAEIFIDLFNLWFDERGGKASCLSALENEGISLLRLSTALRRLGPNTEGCFKNFYNFWFDRDGEPTNFLSNLQRHGINLSNVLDIFPRLTMKSLKLLEDLYYLWFNQDGDETQYSSTLQMNGVDLNEMVKVLYKTDTEVITTSTTLYNLWFDESGNKTHHLLVVERTGKTLSDVVKTLSRSGKRSVRKFMILVNK